MSPSTSVSQIIENLQADAALHADNTRGILRILVDPNGSVDLFIAIDCGSNCIGFLLRCPLSQVPANIDSIGTDGFRLGLYRFKDDGRESACLGVFCKQLIFNDIFKSFLEDLSNHVLLKKTSTDAIRVTISRIELWQRLFSRSGLGILSIEEQAGLFGELTFLKTVITLKGPLQAVDSWKGPTQAPQDFIIGKIAVEIKTSLSRNTKRLMINGTTQLDEAPFSNLFLVHMTLTQTGNASLSLMALVTEVRIILETSLEALNRFNDKLILIGWVHSQEHNYAATSFHLSERAFFQVRGTFPRIRPLNLPLGVIDADYQIDISSQSEFLVNQSTVEKELST